MSDPLWTAREVASATGGLADGEFSALGVTFDSREVQPGDLFVALQGIRDGHDFVADAFAAGAVGALVTRPVAGGPFVLVADTLKALEALASAPNQKIIMMPLEASSVIGSLAGLAQITGEAFGGSGQGAPPATPRPNTPRSPRGSVPAV